MKIFYIELGYTVKLTIIYITLKSKKIYLKKETKFIYHTFSYHNFNDLPYKGSI